MEHINMNNWYSDNAVNLNHQTTGNYGTQVNTNVDRPVEEFKQDNVIINDNNHINNNHIINNNNNNNMNNNNNNNNNSYQNNSYQNNNNMNNNMHDNNMADSSGLIQKLEPIIKEKHVYKDVPMIKENHVYYEKHLVEVMVPISTNTVYREGEIQGPAIEIYDAPRIVQGGQQAYPFAQQQVQDRAVQQHPLNAGTLQQHYQQHFGGNHSQQQQQQQMQQPGAIPQVYADENGRIPEEQLLALQQQRQLESQRLSQYPIQNGQVQQNGQFQNGQFQNQQQQQQQYAPNGYAAQSNVVYEQNGRRSSIGGEHQAMIADVVHQKALENEKRHRMADIMMSNAGRSRMLSHQNHHVASA